MKPRMLSLIVCAGLLTTGFLSAQETTEKHKFSYKGPETGDVQGANFGLDVNMEIDVSMGGQVVQSMSQSQKRATKKKSTVLAAKDGVVSKFKVAYEEVTNTMKMTDGSGNEMDMSEAANLENDSELAGQTLIVEFSEGGMKVTKEDGSAASDATVAAIKRSDAHNGKFSSWGPDMRKLIPEREIAVGEVIKVSGADAMGLVTDSGAKLEDAGAEANVSLTFKGVKKVLGAECGIFDVALEFKAKPDQDAPVKISALPKGELLVGTADLRLYTMKIEGDMNLEGAAGGEGAEAEMQVEIAGKGRVKMDWQCLYGKAEAK